MLRDVAAAVMGYWTGFINGIACALNGVMLGIAAYNLRADRRDRRRAQEIQQDIDRAMGALNRTARGK